MANKRKQLTTAEKFAEYEQVRQQAHRKIDTLDRYQLKKFLKRNGRELIANCSGVQPQQKSKGELCQ
jgi:hypothetical protein